MRKWLVVMSLMVMACGGATGPTTTPGQCTVDCTETVDSPTADAGSECLTLWRNWSLATCPATSSGCLSFLNLVGCDFGINSMVLETSEGTPVCSYQLTLSPIGDLTSNGTGSTGAVTIDSTATSEDVTICDGYQNIDFSWILGCTSLSITDAAGTAIYQ